jgi:citrate lyase subunit beta/citryl-CoA lyase
MLRGPRSLLTVPANRADMLAKAPRYGADALILDLEDSVPVAQKAKARELARDCLERNRAAVRLYVRINSPEVGMLRDDLDAVVVRGLEGVKLPKAESPETVREVDAALTRLEVERGLAPGAIGIELGLESAKGVWFAYDIVAASPRVRSVMVGTAENGDLQTDLGYIWTAAGDEVLAIRSHVALAAHAAGVKHVLDGAYSNVRDAAGLRVCCEAARRLGYRGKSVIHPIQVETVNRLFDVEAE